MGDHFVLLVDRLLTESTLEAAIESRNKSLQATASAVDDTEPVNSSPKVDLSSPRKIVECRICQDEDEDSNMETPCSCCGSLKNVFLGKLQQGKVKGLVKVCMLIADVYKDGAMRRATQPVKYAIRAQVLLCIVYLWCYVRPKSSDHKCATFQHFKPGYTAPPPLFQIGSIPMNLRGNWEISRRELNSSRFIAVVSTDRNLLDSGYDEYSVSNTRSFICYRTVAIIVTLFLSPSYRVCVCSFFCFMLLLIMRHTLPVMLSRINGYSFLLFMLFVLRTVGIVLPLYVLVKVVTGFYRHRQQQETPASLFTQSDEEPEHSSVQPQSHIINVR
ncbi:zinc finger protein [Theobroma cacao]|nr:zinc finger protein [Theobroma cacao]